MITAVLGATEPVAAQGPVYRERWGYLHLEHRRSEVLRELAGRDAATVARVADLLASPDGGLPFAPVAAALAHLRGVPADLPFVVRATVSAFLLPEVVDPDATQEACRAANVSVFLPFTVARPGDMQFVCEVRKEGAPADAVPLWQTTLTEQTSVEDLRMARPRASAPGADLTDGAYEMRVATRIDGGSPRPHDPELRWVFHVQRGYQKRAEQAFAAGRELSPKLAPLPRALLEGIALPVGSSYAGEAFEVHSSGPADLAALESALHDAGEGKDVLDGLAGDILTSLPVPGQPNLPCVLRRAVAEGPRPLVVFAPGTPSYDGRSWRPTAPETRGARWLAAELTSFGTTLGWHVAFLDSPGGRDYATALQAALTSLRAVLPVGDRPVVLVAEREAAAVAGYGIAALRERLAGLVLVGAGGLSGPQYAALGSLPLRYVLPRGLVASDGIQRSLDFLATQTKDGRPDVDVGRFAIAPPWSFGVAMAGTEIEAFVAQVVGR